MASSNKTISVHISKEQIYLLEGRLNAGAIQVSRTAVVGQAAQFFRGDLLIDMAGMVDTIISTLKVNSFSAKQVSIVYDNNIEVEFFLDEKLTNFRRNRAKSMSSIDISSLFKKGNKEETPIKRLSTGVITHKKAWDAYVTESEQGQLISTSNIDRDFVEFLISEFQGKGYKVLSIEPVETTLLYFRKVVPYTYDALNKLVVCADSKDRGTMVFFTKDAPSGSKNFIFDMTYAESFIQGCVATIDQEIQKSRLRNPHIILVGNAFRDIDEYLDLCDELREGGFNIIDIYNLWDDQFQPFNMVHAESADQHMEIDINPAFGVCLGALMRTLEQKPENLIEGSHPMFLSPTTKRNIGSIAKSIACVFAIYAFAMLGISGYQVYTAEGVAEKAREISTSQLSSVEYDRDDAKEKTRILQTIDTRYNDIFKFVYAQVSDNLNIASVDTMDMIPTTGGTESVYAEGEEPAEPAPVSLTDYEMKTIVIRGYSRTSDGPVELYRNLASAGLGEVKIVGVEQVLLPSGETIFAFEMTVGPY